MPTERYDRVARALHWSVAMLLPFQLALGFTAERVASRYLADRLLASHFQLGMLILGLMAARALWWAVRAAAAGPVTVARGCRRYGAGSVHVALYVLMLVLPASGYVIWIWMGEDRVLFGLIEVPRWFDPPADDESGRALAWYVHVYGAWLLSVLVVVHVAAALWHEFVLKDGLIRRRMLRGD
jgi:cytochrome b561